MKVLPLQHYDVIIGYEWLERFSPMKVHWGDKWMVLTYEGQNWLFRAVVQVLHISSEDLSLATNGKPELQGELSSGIHQLLQEFEDVFVAKVEFPPPRDCCHTIPLIPGARRVTMRPHRYAPALKDEIEQQV
jgi:hypothetical protein